VGEPVDVAVEPVGEDRRAAGRRRASGRPGRPGAGEAVVDGLEAAAHGLRRLLGVVDPVAGEDRLREAGLRAVDDRPLLGLAACRDRDQREQQAEQQHAERPGGALLHVSAPFAGDEADERAQCTYMTHGGNRQGWFEAKP
jgi:hypothetical protein